MDSYWNKIKSAFSESEEDKKKRQLEERLNQEKFDEKHSPEKREEISKSFRSAFYRNK